MREIKFRAWDKQEKQMIYSVQDVNDYCINHKSCLISVYAEYFGELLEDDAFSVTQYSGLKDKNGKDIYEGDIVKFKGSNDHYYETICPDLTYFHFWQETADNEDREVIGNIYE